MPTPGRPPGTAPRRRLVPPRVIEHFVASKFYQVGRHRDFRLMWLGAFLSFIGSFVQNIAQGYLVAYELHGGPFKLAMVSFCGMVPFTFIGPVAGVLSDTLDKRKLLVITQAIFAAGAIYLAIATWMGFVQYWQILVVALILGVVSAIETPTRQSIVSQVVPAADLPAAIPINAMTFNFARIIGPVIGGILLGPLGPATCYLVNGISFFALIFAGLAIKADLSAVKRDPQPIGDLIFEGALFTFRERHLRTIFLLESMISMFGLFYLTQMAEIGKKMLGLSRDNLSMAYLAVGIGTICSLFVVTSLSHLPLRSFILRGATSLMGVCLLVLATTNAERLWLAYLMFGLLGAAGVAIFNTSNMLFQTLSPDRLRGRVLAMHMWALTGIGPFGILGLGLLADHIGLPETIALGGGIVILTAAISWLYRAGFAGVDSPQGTIPTAVSSN